MKNLNEGGVVYAQLDMIPADHKNDVFRVETLIAKMNAQFHAVKSFRKNGIRDFFLITAIGLSPDVAADFFATPTIGSLPLPDRDAPIAPHR